MSQETLMHKEEGKEKDTNGNELKKKAGGKWENLRKVKGSVQSEPQGPDFTSDLWAPRPSALLARHHLQLSSRFLFSFLPFFSSFSLFFLIFLSFLFPFFLLSFLLSLSLPLNDFSLLFWYKCIQRRCRSLRRTNCRVRLGCSELWLSEGACGPSGGKQRAGCLPLSFHSGSLCNFLDPS